ncbi:MAG: hypothetical protein CMJ74_07455 [Planctomycetaceae bacterium]|nr:hypothetical protein [Planctomycetaceae bacterium]
MKSNAWQRFLPETLHFSAVRGDRLKRLVHFLRWECAEFIRHRNGEPIGGLIPDHRATGSGRRTHHGSAHNAYKPMFISRDGHPRLSTLLLLKRG